MVRNALRRVSAAQGRRAVCRTLLCLALFPLVLGVRIAGAEGETEPEPRWFLLEFAKTRPTCSETGSEARCLGTQPRVASFEIRDSERLEMPASERIPPAWAAFNRVWVYAPAVIEGAVSRSIEIAATPIGARLIISDRGAHYLQSVTLNRWQQLDSDGSAKIWVRVTPLTR